MPSSSVRARVRTVLATAGIAAGTVVLAAPAASAATPTTVHHAHTVSRPAHHPMLRRGSAGHPVRWVQQRLGLRITGHFGARTDHAVRRFQWNHNLEVDGIVGPHTWHALLQRRSHHATGRASRSHRHATPHFLAMAHRVLAFTAKQQGKPYVYGAAGPHSFDCSGLVQYVFKHAIGRDLPHNTDAQWQVIKHIRRAQLKPGDLIYVRDYGHLSHVGIYAGRGYWWVAPHTGEHVKKQKIYPASHVYGRAI